MEALATQRSTVGAALIATLWHPYLGAALGRMLGWALPAHAGSLPLIAAALAGAWLVIFLTEFALSTSAPRLFRLDTVLVDPARSVADKLRAIAASWLGRVLLVGFAAYLCVLALGMLRFIAG